MAFVHIKKDKNPSFGKTRTEQDDNLRREGWGSGFASEEQRDHCKFLEKKIKDGYTTDGRVYLNQKQIMKLMKQYGVK
ncbi:MAG: hypothetical protein ABIF11_05460 [Nitrospirota bacterium]|uniref:Uncharacterized protein n=1 Tax=viral metagenome TaxID=1070528 RepID=A0A6M3L704_9ZZZZ